ncbi:MAG: hypothetical protein ACLUOB_04785 [Subdoligranulum sp.]
MNEKAIVKRMKAAAKAAGCKIWRNEHDVLVLCGGGWCFVCEWGNCPPAVLGCLAEWLHGLPRPGSGYWYKGYPDPEPLDCQPPELAALIGRAGEDLILSPPHRNAAACPDPHRPDVLVQHRPDRHAGHPGHHRRRDPAARKG